MITNQTYLNKSFEIVKKINDLAIIYSYSGYGLINENNEFIVIPDYLSYDFKENLNLVVFKNWLYSHIFDLNDKKFIFKDLTIVNFIREDAAILKNKDALFVYDFNQKKKILPPIFDQFVYYENNISLRYKNIKYNSYTPQLKISYKNDILNSREFIKQIFDTVQDK